MHFRLLLDIILQPGQVDRLFRQPFEKIDLLVEESHHVIPEIAVDVLTQVECFHLDLFEHFGLCHVQHDVFEGLGWGFLLGTGHLVEVLLGNGGNVEFELVDGVSVGLVVQVLFL